MQMTQFLLNLHFMSWMRVIHAACCHMLFGKRHMSTGREIELTEECVEKHQKFLWSANLYGVLQGAAPVGRQLHVS